jgi:hypothetical protein
MLVCTGSLWPLCPFTRYLYSRFSKPLSEAHESLTYTSFMLTFRIMPPIQESCAIQLKSGTSRNYRYWNGPLCFCTPTVLSS